jgi:hypothetical protein
MNCVKLTGRLTGEPDLKHIGRKKKRAVCEMRVAVVNGGRYPTTFISLSVFDAPAYAAAEHLTKGSIVKVERRIEIPRADLGRRSVQRAALHRGAGRTDRQRAEAETRVGQSTSGHCRARARMSGATERPEIRSIFGVLVPGREEGFYLFADLHDAEDFAWAVRDNGNVAELSEELLYPYQGISELIEAEEVTGAMRLAPV